MNKLSIARNEVKKRVLGYNLLLITTRSKKEPVKIKDKNGYIGSSSFVQMLFSLGKYDLGQLLKH